MFTETQNGNNYVCGVENFKAHLLKTYFFAKFSMVLLDLLPHFFTDFVHTDIIGKRKQFENIFWR